ncbi:MAG TPA: NAD(P)/FAD-dependent oxidoreductase [Burkholderiaceae bacterium]|nr:NAD(P)/FAD-dependent oxidoreductase [Burkholderiaceae bacterium]
MDHKIVIVGGGAGGLELAARLGRRHGPDQVFLIDRDESHIWKPSLHEVASGTLDIHREGLSYRMLAKERRFTFVPGNVHNIDRERRCVQIEAFHSAQGQLVFDARDLPYDTLVVAVGSKSHFFGTPGAAEYAITLDSTTQAEYFRQQMLHELAAIARQREQGVTPEPVLQIGIVGGGATGVELAAELLEAINGLTFYGTRDIDPQRNVKITLLEGSGRILAALPERLSVAASQLLAERGIDVRTSIKVTQVGPDFVQDDQGNRYPVDLCVWAAGIQAPAFLGELGLPVNRINQLVVDEFLRTSDPDIFALGDCAQAPWLNGEGFLPARAQVAHQQANYLCKVIAARVKGDSTPSPKPFRFKDYGSLIAVGHSRGVGTLMGVLAGKSLFVEGLLARFMYMSLHLMHHMAVLGFWRTASLAMGRLLMKRSTPRVKLH